MYYKTHILVLMLMLTATACDVKLDGQAGFTATPLFITATLPATPIPIPTLTPVPPTPIPTITPIEGTTTTQVNVRAETSTASETLGMIAQFSTLQIIGKDSSGSWFQIIYSGSPTGTGWVRAEYVQVKPSAEIPVIETGAGNRPGMSGLVIQKINVRNGPGIGFEILGELNPNDVVFMISKDSSGAWIQIEYAGGVDETAWAAAEFLQIEDASSLPVIGIAEQTPQAQVGVVASPATAALTAMQDGDSIGSPMARVVIAPTGSRAFQVNGDISSPSGDIEDWIEFTSYRETIVIQVSCSDRILQVELWNQGALVEGFLLACGEMRVLKITPNQSYSLRLSNPASSDLIFTKYILRVKSVH